MEESVFSLLYRALNEHLEDLRNHILSGTVESYEDYRAASAKYEMCRRIEEDVKEIERRFMAQN
jgi:hypothetical protein